MDNEKEKQRAPGAAKTEADYQTEITKLEEKNNQLEKKVEEANNVVSDLKTKLKEKGSSKAGNPTVKIDGVLHEITIPRSKHPEHGLVTTERIQNEPGLAEALLKEGFGGLIPAVKAKAQREKDAADRLARTKKSTDKNVNSIKVQ